MVAVAKRSVGRTNGSQAAITSLHNLMIQYELIMMQLGEVESRMQEYLLQVPNAAKLAAIKGLGPVSVAVIVSEIGDISRFCDPRQLIKYAGLNLRENSSRRNKGKTAISKRGVDC